MDRIASLSDDLIFLGGLTWYRDGKHCWRAADRFAEYTICRKPDDRWHGYWMRNGIKTRAEWSCPTIETYAEYLIDQVRHARLELD